jgi:hypothetical protein
MNSTITNAAPDSAAFFRIINNPVKFRLFLLQKLPAAYFSGLRIIKADEHHCSVAIPFKWCTQNPFRSTYFACLSMAAEMSTGVLGMANIYKMKPGVSMLIVGNEGKFYKKAIGKTIFTCEDGAAIKSLINEALRTGEAQTFSAKSAGYNKQNELIAEFLFTWSFKRKS